MLRERLLETVEDEVEAELELAQVLAPRRRDVLLGVLGEMRVAGPAQHRDELGNELLRAQPAEDVVSRAATFVPRVGPMTVTMALRNTLRLYFNAV